MHTSTPDFLKIFPNLFFNRGAWPPLKPPMVCMVIGTRVLCLLCEAIYVPAVACERLKDVGNVL